MRKVIVVAAAVAAAEIVGVVAHAVLAAWLAWPVLAVAGYVIVDNALAQYHS